MREFLFLALGFPENIFRRFKFLYRAVKVLIFNKEPPSALVAPKYFDVIL